MPMSGNDRLQKVQGARSATTHEIEREGWLIARIVAAALFMVAVPFFGNVVLMTVNLATYNPNPVTGELPIYNAWYISAAFVDEVIALTVMHFMLHTVSERLLNVLFWISAAVIAAIYVTFPGQIAAHLAQLHGSGGVALGQRGGGGSQASGGANLTWYVFFFGLLVGAVGTNTFVRLAKDRADLQLQKGAVRSADAVIPEHHLLEVELAEGEQIDIDVMMTDIHQVATSVTEQAGEVTRTMLDWHRTGRVRPAAAIDPQVVLGFEHDPVRVQAPLPVDVDAYFPTVAEIERILQQMAFTDENRRLVLAEANRIARMATQTEIVAKLKTAMTASSNIIWSV